MIDWHARAQAVISQTAYLPTAKTDRTDVSAVSSGRSRPVCRKTHGVSAVSSVGVVALFENCISADVLIDAAMRACDHWNDSPRAREEMRQQCLEVPAHHRAELRDHFIKAYRKEST